VRDQPPLPELEPEDDSDRPGRLRPVPPGALVGWTVVGLAVGWFVHPLSERWRGAAPNVSWLPSVALLFVGVFLLFTARSTARAMRGEGERPPGHQMVNRFVLARACALVGAFFAGGYAGYALSWVGDEAGLATDRLLRSAAAAVAAVLMTVGAVLLERACRTRSDDPGT